jgi:SAM-dependent methyltransferase
MAPAVCDAHTTGELVATGWADRVTVTRLRSTGSVEGRTVCGTRTVSRSAGFEGPGTRTAHVPAGHLARTGHPAEMARRGDAGPLPHLLASSPMTTSSTDTVAGSPVFAALYDPFLWLGERAGMGARRRELLTRVRGRTLEIGSGTGLNLRHYPEHVDDLVLAEPDPSMRRRLEDAVRTGGRAARVIDARAEALPVPDGSIDTVVSTLVLCTVDAPDAALREIARVLRPGGQLLFLEHVRSDSPTLARWQDRLAGPWQRFAEGCRCNRATLELIEACGFRADARPAAWPAMPPIVRPLVIGRATVPA